jgi:hypothetical protein
MRGGMKDSSYPDSTCKKGRKDSKVRYEERMEGKDGKRTWRGNMERREGKGGWSVSV